MTPVQAFLASLAGVLGLALVWVGAPKGRRPDLATRVGPYLRALAPRRSRLLDLPTSNLMPVPAMERVFRPLLDDAARMLGRWLGGSHQASQRLVQVGRPAGLTQFRLEQVLWGGAGFLIGCAVGIGLPAAAGRPVNALFALGVVAFGVVGGVLGRDWWLGQEIARRSDRIRSELPTVADLLCLAVTAGEGLRAAVERAASRVHGDLSQELAQVVADVRAGAPFTVAMESLARRVPLPEIARFVDGVVIAVERGTPLADVLRSQAADVREQHRRGLIEAGGRKEVYMLIPVVFLILPVVVLFALYPGFYSLSIVAH